MNDTSNRYSRVQPQEVDQLLERGKHTPHKVVNSLAQTMPQADHEYQQALEEQVMAKFTTTTQERHPLDVNTRRFPQFTKGIILSPLAWVASLVATILLSVFVFNLPSQTFLTPNQQTPGASETTITVPIVVAAQNISSGTLITEEMIQVIQIAVHDLLELQTMQPERELLSSMTDAIGQKAAIDIFWFQPVAKTFLGEIDGMCDPEEPGCPRWPAEYSQIIFPADEIVTRGLKIGDRVDVLAQADGRLRPIVENVLLMDIQPEQVTFAAPFWKHGILVWLYHTGEQYALRLHIEKEMPMSRDELTEYTFTVPHILPENYRFDLIIKLPLAEGYLLVDAPAPLDHIDYTQSGEMMWFWFKAFEIVAIEVLDGESQIVVRLSEGDTTNLDYLLKLEATLSFVPRSD